VIEDEKIDKKEYISNDSYDNENEDEYYFNNDDIVNHLSFLDYEYVPVTNLGMNSQQLKTEETTEVEQFVTIANLNLRPSPSTYGERLLLVSSGQKVNVLDARDGEWFSVEYNGIKGYMHSRYLRMPSPPVQKGEVGAVELLHWDVARYYMTIGVAATIIDVRTGLTWQVASFSNGRHADVETLTAEDTAIMLQAFGGRWSWEPRPVVVVINGRSIAASINGMPHAQQTRSGNNMNGHVCLHFLGSRTNNGNRSHERDHQNAVQEAYRTASNW
jgi:hypothetical protein